MVTTRLLRQILLSIMISMLSSTASMGVVTQSRLDTKTFAVVAINGERKLVKENQVLQVIWGDKISFPSPPQVAASHSKIIVRELDGKTTKTVASLEGGSNFPTSQPFKESKHTYVITQTMASAPAITWQLEVVVPEFRYAVIELNGKEYVIRDKLGLKVKRSDKLKVKRLVTNMGELDDSLGYQVEPDTSLKGSISDQVYSLRISRFDRVFASFPMEVTE